MFLKGGKVTHELPSSSQESLEFPKREDFFRKIQGVDWPTNSIEGFLYTHVKHVLGKAGKETTEVRGVYQEPLTVISPEIRNSLSRKKVLKRCRRIIKDYRNLIEKGKPYLTKKIELEIPLSVLKKFKNQDTSFLVKQIEDIYPKKGETKERSKKYTFSPYEVICYALNFLRFQIEQVYERNCDPQRTLKEIYDITKSHENNILTYLGRSSLRPAESLDKSSQIF